VSCSAQEFSIAASEIIGDNNAAIDLEYLALFPASITDAQADSVRNYINTRNNVFSLIDSQGYYFFDPQALTDGDLNSTTKKLTGLWDGRIVGSDNGDTSFIASQGTSDDQPTSDKYTLTFADNTDHLTITNPNQAGWQVVGTSLGTFAYRVNNNAVTELNLLGNLGRASYRQTGDLYGIILLPESATGADIEAARKLLIDRGAADSSNSTSYLGAWLNRYDIVEFTGVDMSGVVNAQNAWDGCTNMVKFGVTDLSNSNNLSYAWYNTSSLTEFPSGANLGTSASNVAFRFSWQLSGLTSFPALDLSKGNDFTSAWQNCSALSSFPADAKLGTSANNVNFTQAWQLSGLTSFPALDLSTGNSFHNAFNGCSALTSFSAGAKLGTSAQNVNFTNAWRSSGLTSFPALDLSNGSGFHAAWYSSSITQFASGVDLNNATDVSYAWGYTPLTSFPLVQVGNVPYFLSSWQNCTLLTDFSAGVFTNWNPSSISPGVFNNTWKYCNSLTAQSVENILTSIDASGQHGTDDGTSTGNPLGDSGIDIDYNVATGSLSAATNSAVTSLKAKGWSIIVNNVTL
jgi:hypothetical protein